MQVQSSQLPKGKSLCKNDVSRCFAIISGWAFPAAAAWTWKSLRQHVTLCTVLQSMSEDLPLLPVLPMTVKCPRSGCCHFGHFRCLFITFCVSRRRCKMYCGHVRLCVCLSVCLSVCGRTPTLLHGPGYNLGAW